MKKKVCVNCVPLKKFLRISLIKKWPGDNGRQSCIWQTLANTMKSIIFVVALSSLLALTAAHGLYSSNLYRLEDYVNNATCVCSLRLIAEEEVIRAGNALRESPSHTILEAMTSRLDSARRFVTLLTTMGLGSNRCRDSIRQVAEPMNQACKQYEEIRMTGSTEWYAAMRDPYDQLNQLRTETFEACQSCGDNCESDELVNGFRQRMIEARNSFDEQLEQGRCSLTDRIAAIHTEAREAADRINQDWLSCENGD